MRSAPLCGYATEPHTRPDCGLTPVVAFGATRLCASCAARRSTLGKGQRPRPLQAPAVDVLTWLAAAERDPVSYTHLRAHETRHDLVCRLLLEKKKKTTPTETNKKTI